MFVFSIQLVMGCKMPGPSEPSLASDQPLGLQIYPLGASSWGVLGCPGASWGVLGRPGASLGCPGACWGVLGRPGVSWGVLGRAGASWGALGRSGTLWGVLGRPGASWGVLGCPGGFCLGASWGGGPRWYVFCGGTDHLGVMPLLGFGAVGHKFHEM